MRLEFKPGTVYYVKDASGKRWPAMLAALSILDQRISEDVAKEMEKAREHD